MTGELERARATVRPGRRLVAALLCIGLGALGGCYPSLDWREYRPDCTQTWCAFVVAFPDRPTSATRGVLIGEHAYPLTLHVATARRLTFAIGVFDLSTGGDAGAAREVFERKLLDDVGATAGEHRPVVLEAANRARVAAVVFDVHGQRDGRPLTASARFVERPGRLIEAVVIGPADAFADAEGRQAVETFFTSLRFD